MSDRMNQEQELNSGPTGNGTREAEPASSAHGLIGEPSVRPSASQEVDSLQSSYSRPHPIQPRYAQHKRLQPSYASPPARSPASFDSMVHPTVSNSTSPSPAPHNRTATRSNRSQQGTAVPSRRFGSVLDTAHMQLLTSQDWEAICATASLTKREAEVCTLLLSCKTRNAIADCLGIKPRTVRQHLENLHVKLNVTNRVELVLRVISIRDAARSQSVFRRNMPGDA